MHRVLSGMMLELDSYVRWIILEPSTDLSIVLSMPNELAFFISLGRVELDVFLSGWFVAKESAWARTRLRLSIL